MTRQETRSLVKDIESARDPFERFALEQDRLKKALDGGAISEDVYNRLLRDKEKMLPVVASGLSTYGSVIGVVASGYLAAVSAGTAFVAFLRIQQNAIDDTADTASRLGVSFTDLKSLEFGFKEGAGLDGKSVEDAIKKFQINVIKAIDGDQGIRAAFARLGLDANQLLMLGPQQGMLRLADAMQGIGSHAERLKLAMDILGKSGSDLASTLGAGSEKLQESVAFAERWLGLTEEQVSAVGSNNDAWDRIGVVVEGIGQKLGAEFAPAMESVANYVLKISEGFGDIDTKAKAFVELMYRAVGFMQDAAEFGGMIGKNLPSATGLIGGPMSVEEILGLVDDTSLQLDKTKQKTEEFWQQQFEFAGMALGDRLSSYDKELAAIDKINEARQKGADELQKKEEERIKRMEDAANREAEKALREVERKFEAEIKRQQQLQADVAKGPGSGFGADSAEAAKYLAEQTNKAIAESAVKVDQKPTDQQLVEQAKIQVSIARAQDVHLAEMIAKIRDLKTAVEENGFEGVR